MNKFARHTAAGIALAASLSPLASAADGTINFSGRVLGSTCQIGFSNGDSINVALPTVYTNTLAEAGQATGRTPFSISISDCGEQQGSVQTGFGPDANIDTATNNLKLAAGSGTDPAAANVQIQLLNANGDKILLGNNTAQQNSPAVQIQDGGATLNYFAEYIAVNGAAAAGSANSSVAFTMIYQ